MHLTQLKLIKCPENAGLLAKLMSSKYAEHQVLWELSGAPQDAKRDFLFRCDTTAIGVEMLVLSRDTLSNVGPEWDVKSKPYAPTFAVGQLLGFKLRASPTFAKFRPGQRGLQQDLVRTVYAEAIGAITLQVAAQAAGERWLEKRALSAGFRVIECNASGYETHTLQDKGAAIHVPSLDMEGLLEIVDPVLFAAKQIQGYGKTKFAGMGLMLVRPV